MFHEYPLWISLNQCYPKASPAGFNHVHSTRINFCLFCSPKSLVNKNKLNASGQMCFKSEIVAEIARLHENSAYSILGVSPEASDSESWQPEGGFWYLDWAWIEEKGLWVEMIWGNVGLRYFDCKWFRVIHYARWRFESEFRWFEGVFPIDAWWFVKGRFTINSCLTAETTANYIPNFLVVFHHV